MTTSATRLAALMFAATAVLAGRAAAQPEPCAVRLVRAPEDVAQVMSARIAALGACAHRLDVWIVRTPDGLYLVAQDALGRVRERVVPDAEVAAALIASWVELADVPAAPPPPPPAPAAASPVVPTRPPGLVDERERHDDEIDLPAPWTEPSPPLASLPAGGATVAIGAHLGVTWDGDTTTGGHIELEAGRRGAWFTAIDGVVEQEVAGTYYVIDAPQAMSSYNEIGRTGVDAMLRTGVQMGNTRYLRPSLAVGAGISRHEILATDAAVIGAPSASTYTDWSVGFRLGVALTAGVQFGRYAIELDLAQVASMQRAKPGVSGDDRSLSAGLGIRFHR